MSNLNQIYDQKPVVNLNNKEIKKENFISLDHIRKEFKELTNVFREGNYSLSEIEQYEQLKNKVAIANPYDTSLLKNLFLEVTSMKSSFINLKDSTYKVQK